MLSPVTHSISDDDKIQMTDATTAPCSSPTTPENSVKAEKKKKSIIPKIFGSKRIGRERSEEDINQLEENNHDMQNDITSRTKVFLESSSSPEIQKCCSERHNSARIDGLNLSNFDQSMAPATIVQDIRVFVATWNVGGKTPNYNLNFEDFLQVEGSSDIYVLGFQEIVPLSAGNVLVIEDNEPASRWLALISRALNKSYHESLDSSDSSTSQSKHLNTLKDTRSNFFHKPSLKVLTKNLRANNSLLKACNCSSESSAPNRRTKNLTDPSASSFCHRDSSTDDLLAIGDEISTPAELNYVLIASKQMVGIFLTIWARKELVRHIGHLRISWLGRGIMGFLGNKGCISISMTLHQTSFCFVCSHLASGEKEGDELRRNEDVAEILKNTQFQKVCKRSHRQIPERIIDHERIIWLGDLNYRVSLSYEKTRLLLEDNNWDALLEKDQLNIEREAGRVFSDWDEGKILFAPTYKYTHNSDSYAGETVKSKKKRRTPAWCDRILWRGKGIEQLSYIRGESRFSDHRPVCSVFTVEVEMKNKNTAKFRKGFSCSAAKLEYGNCVPERHSFYEF